jgi:hypothetical protein
VYDINVGEFMDPVFVAMSEAEFNSIIENMDQVGTGTVERCSICQSELSSDIVRVPCGHKYHHHCIKSLLTEFSTRCPSCRADLREFVE